MQYRCIRLPETDSTNTVLRQLAMQNAPEGTVVIADHQSAGRGRMGRSFLSPAGTGLYMSLLLRPTIPAAQAMMKAGEVSI